MTFRGWWSGFTDRRTEAEEGLGIVTVEGTELAGGPAGRATTMMVRETSRQDSVVAIGLLLGILGILIVVAAIMGTLSIGWA